MFVTGGDHENSDDRFDTDLASDAELCARVTHLEAARTALDAAEADALAALERRGVCDRDHGLATHTWLARETMLPAGLAKTRARVARALHDHFHHVAAALADGRIGWEHARVIVDTANPRNHEAMVAGQDVLVGLAEGCRFDQWQREVRALARQLDHDGGYDPNTDPNTNRLSVGVTLDGLVSLTGTLTRTHGELLTQALETKTDELHRRARRDHQACPDLPIPARTTLRALALVELIRQAQGVDPTTTTGPVVEATMILHAGDPTTATNPDGVTLDDGTVRQLSCGARLRALVEDTHGVPLHLGRTTRWVTPHQRLAVHHRDGGCTFPGCNARPAWCDTHHCTHWHHGGTTDLTNLASLCRHHHGVAHRTGWSVTVTTDGWTIFTTPTGPIWGQRHGRTRAGPPPTTPDHPNHHDAA